MTSQTRELVLIFIAGLFLGSFFFGGLWWTVSRLLVMKGAGMWLMISLFLRFSVTLYGFYLIAPYGIAGLVVALGGFLIARIGITRFAGATQLKNLGQDAAPHAD